MQQLLLNDRPKLLQPHYLLPWRAQRQEKWSHLSPLYSSWEKSNWREAMTGRCLAAACYSLPKNVIQTVTVTKINNSKFFFWKKIRNCMQIWAEYDNDDDVQCYINIV